MASAQACCGRRGAEVGPSPARLGLSPALPKAKGQITFGHGIARLFAPEAVFHRGRIRNRSDRDVHRLGRPAGLNLVARPLPRRPVFPPLDPPGRPPPALSCIGLAWLGVNALLRLPQPACAKTVLTFCLATVVTYTIKEELKLFFGRTWPETFTKTIPPGLACRPTAFISCMAAKAGPPFPPVTPRTPRLR